MQVDFVQFEVKSCFEGVVCVLGFLLPPAIEVCRK